MKIHFTLPTYLLTDLFIYLVIYLLLYIFIYLLTYKITVSTKCCKILNIINTIYINTFIYLLLALLNLFTYWITISTKQLFFHSVIYLFIHLCAYLLIDLLNYLLNYLFTYLLTKQCQPNRECWSKCQKWNWSENLVKTNPNMFSVLFYLFTYSKLW